MSKITTGETVTIQEAGGKVESGTIISINETTTATEPPTFTPTYRDPNTGKLVLGADKDGKPIFAEDPPQEKKNAQ